MKLRCFDRGDGKIGVRNHVVVIPTVLCANAIAQKIVEQAPDAIVLPHAGGCTCGEDIARLQRVLAGLGAHPNVAGVLLVGLGCENCDSRLVAEQIARRAPWKPLERLVIQQIGVSKTIRDGTKIAQQMLRKAADCKRSDADLSDLTLALECGGSDATSGLAANPALGLAADRLIGLGGAAMFSETTEAIGAEHLLAERAINREVARQITDTIGQARRRMTTRLAPGEHFLPPGNIDGGLTTLEEKSLGCICKTGSTAITEVVAYGEVPKRKGMIFVDGTGFDIPSITGMVAAGAQIVAFTTGRGNPVGYPIAPVVKITGNEKTYEKLQEVIDVDASGIVRAEQQTNDVAEEIFREIVAAAGGKPVKAETMGRAAFAVSTVAGASSGV